MWKFALFTIRPTAKLLGNYRMYRFQSNETKSKIQIVENSERNSFNLYKIGFIGASFGEGQPHRGVELAPEYLRKFGIINKIRLLGHTVKDYGDVSIDNGLEIKNQEDSYTRVMRYNQMLSEKVEEVIKQGRFCLTIGGDHSVALGTVHGHAAALPHTCLLWIDAHSDINTRLTSTSGNVHGMPMSFHIRDMVHKHQHSDMEWFEPRINSESVAFIGLRAIDPLERVIINRFNISAFSMQDIDRLGIHEVVSRALNHINPDGSRSIHVSFDIDSLDPSEAPATGTPVRGGLSLREGINLMEQIAATGKLSALDVVEINPELARSEAKLSRTLEAAEHIILASFGHERGGTRPRCILKQEDILPIKH